jgi:sortase (surface protein transpeptidase)
MNIFKLIGELVVIYILYKLIFGFIIPLYNASKQMKGKMSEMQQRMQKQQRADNEQERQYSQPPQMEKATEKISKDDYIDYEEVK